MIRSWGGDKEAENSKFLSGRSIALRRPGRAVAISMTPQLAGRRSAAPWEAPLPCHLPPAALGLAPHPGRAKAGKLRAAQGHSAGSPPGQARFSPCGPDRLPRPPQPLEGRSPAQRGWARGSLQGRPPLPSLPESPCPAGLAPRRPRAARPRTHRRGDSLPPPAGPGQAHVRARLRRRRYAAMAARAELDSVPPSPLPSLLPGLRSPRGRGLSRPYPCGGAGSALLPSRGPRGVRQRRAGRGTRTCARRGAASELGRLRGRCEDRETR